LKNSILSLLYMWKKVLSKALKLQIPDLKGEIIELFSRYQSRKTRGNKLRLSKKLIATYLVSGLLFLNITNGYATTERIKPDYQRNWSDLEEIQKSAPGLVLLNGEITEINVTEIFLSSITEQKESYRLKLVPNTRFFCNGVDTQWEALTPVAPGAYFEAQVLVNVHREAIAISAFYFGEECVVKKCYQKQGRLVVELTSVISEENYIYSVNEVARLPRDDNWKQEGQIVYILYNGLEEIRAVFLPD